MKFKINKPVRLIELFAGIGSQAMALRDLGVEFEHYRVIEFDRFAIASYNAIHGTDFTTKDITTTSGVDLGIVDTDSFIYIMTYSFPCQDLSVAGRGRGMSKGSNTRSGLLWEVERLLNETHNLPQILVMENVTQVHSKKNMPDFQKWLSYLKTKGYKTFWQDLNAKYYGIPQSRNRCIAVSILGDYEFDFPKSIPLDKTMRNYLEDTVDDKYYLTSDKAKALIDRLVADGTTSGLLVGGGEVASFCETLGVQTKIEYREQEKQMCPQLSCQGTTRDFPTTEVTESLSVRELGFIEKGTGKHQSNTVYGTDELCPTITAVSWKAPLKVIECQKLKS